jgi:hypothetical protein
MSNLKVNSINDASGGSAAVLYGVAAPTNSMGFRNRIINGDMRIDQRNAGASVNPPTAIGAYTVDRWGFYNSTSTNRFSVQQNAGAVTPPAGFTNYVGLTVTSAYTPASNDEQLFYQQVEGFNCSDLGWGTANAQTITLSFWVRSSLTGAHSGAIRNPTGYARGYPFSFTVNSANTWEYKTVVIPGDTGGTWNTTNGGCIWAGFNLGSGSSRLSTANVWNTTTGPVGVTGSVQISATNGATFYITGVQLEAGSVASPFERRPYSTELQLAQRYYRKSFNQTTAPAQNAGLVGAVFFKSAASGAGPYGHVSFGTTMRTTPATITTYNPSAANANWRNTTAGSDLNAEVANAGESGVGIGSNTQTMNQYALASIHYTADAEL